MLALLDHQLVLAALLYAVIYFYYNFKNGYCFCIIPTVLSYLCSKIKLYIRIIYKNLCSLKVDDNMI